MKTTVNQRFKMLRQHLGLNQEEMGEAVGLVQATISAIEKEKQDVTPQTLELLHRKFNVSKIWLLDDKGAMFEGKEVSVATTLEEEYVKELKSKNTLLENTVNTLQEELRHAWAMAKYFSGGKVPGFNMAFDNAGLSLLFAGNKLSGAPSAKIN